MMNYDLVVIGSGSGLEISAEAADMGLSVAVVEEGPFGGTCLNRGCILSKILIHFVDVMETIKGAERFGIKAHVTGLDWQFIIRRATEEVDADAQAIEEGNRQAGGGATGLRVAAPLGRMDYTLDPRRGNEEKGVQRGKAPELVLSEAEGPGV